MTEENKNDTPEQQDFLSGHEELLKSIKKDEPEQKETEIAPEEVVEETVPAPEAETESVEKEEPVAEPEVKIEEEPTEEEASATEPEPIPEPEPVIEPEPVAEPEPIEEPEPVVEEPVKAEESKPVPAPAKPKKKKKAKPAHSERNQQEKQRHEELLKHQALEQQEVKEVLNFFKKYVKPAAIGIAVVCILVLANNFFKSNRLKKEAKADAALAQARTAADFQAVLDNYGSTPSAPLAMMGLAMENFNAGQVDQAAELYATFLNKYGRHEMAVQAEFNAITCKEAKDQYGDAHLLYGAFEKSNKGSHLAPMALLGKARCLMALEQYAEAKQVYEDIITFYPESGWSQAAEGKLVQIENKL